MIDRKWKNGIYIAAILEALVLIPMVIYFIFNK